MIEIEEIGTGVTRPMRATLAAGGPVGAFAWKDKKPGIYDGYWESYKAEIAAYELDKLLELHMTPPTVERRVRRELGAAVWWVDPSESFKQMGGSPTPPSAHIWRWNFQLIQAKMFHNLIYNKDPNLGNWLVDPAWNLILIDNSRALTTDTGRRVHELTRIDRDLWDRMEALDEPTLTAALGEWLTDAEIRAILERRDEMQEDIDAMVAERGEAAVFVRFPPVPPVTPAPDRPAPPGTATVDLDRLAGQLVDALNETPVVMPASEISWLGQVVRLAEYEGSDRRVAEAGLDAGHTYGLVTEFDGLICLSPDQWDPEPYTMLEDLVGDNAEVFGVAQEVAGMTVARVTLCRGK